MKNKETTLVLVSRVLVDILNGISHWSWQCDSKFGHVMSESMMLKVKQLKMNEMQYPWLKMKQ